MKYKDEARFHGVYSRNNLLKNLKKEIYVINPDKYDDIGTPWIACYVKSDEVTCFGSFGV